MTRRYEKKQHPAYDQEYNKLFVKSWRINKGIRENSINHFLRLSSKDSCSSELIQMCGNDQGEYLSPDSDDIRKSELFVSEQRIKEAEYQVSEWRRKRENQGFEDIDNVPQRLLDEVLRAQAENDILKFEIKHVKKLMAEYQEAELKAEPTLILRNGPTAEQSRGDDPLYEIDYQRVGRVNGVLCIVDKRLCADGLPNPYIGMAIVDYRKMARKFRKFVTDRHWQRHAELQDEAHKARAKGRHHGGGADLGIYPHAPREDWPKWPDGAINHLAKKETKEIPAK